MAGTLFVVHGYGTAEDGKSISSINRVTVQAALDKLALFPTTKRDVVAVGGYHSPKLEDGPVEAELIKGELLISSISSSLYIMLEMDSMNTIENAEFVRDRFVLEDGYNHVVAFAWRPHSERVRYTWRQALHDTGVRLDIVVVEAPFGRNSQSRLNSPLSWVFWNTLGWIATLLHYRFRF